MPVPYTNETLAELQARFTKALEHVYDQDAIIRRDAIRPGEIPAQVFDFEDGLRLLVSRERSPDGKIFLHVSASFKERCRIVDELRLQIFGCGSEYKARLIFEQWAASIPARFAELAQDNGPPIELIGWSAGRIPHWHREEKASVPT